ncbi:MAG: hypothetical protein HKN76_10745 [Saprospiraceae bacterium]|nr:hypothetical protein [Saprospiraceae bacterium]
MIRSTFILTSLIILYLGCITPPEYPNEPVIELIGITNDTMLQSQFNSDSTLIVFSFTDGDGDLGSDDSLNIFVKDLRDNFISDRFRIPFVDEAGANNGISGEITITLYTTCCTFPNGAPPCQPSEEFPTNQLQYEIYIKDRAGNQSNSITTPPIILECK